MSGPVLVVDDDPDVRESIAELLRVEGFAVAVAEDGRAALEHLRSGARRPALILLDLVMPRMSGWQLLEQLRADAAMRSIPVCTVSSSDTADPKGAQHAIHKPFHVDALLNLVARYADRTVARLHGGAMHRERMSELGLLAAGTAHEINNALAYLMTNLALSTELVRRLGDGVPPAQRAEILDILGDAFEGASRVQRIARDLQAVSRGEGELLTNVDLRSVIETALRMTSHEIRHRATVVKDLEDVPDVEGDEPRLVQVFVNLVVNAAHAIPEGGADQNHVRIAMRTDGGRVLVEVEDTGCGMNAAVLPHIFEPFFTTKPRGLGTGLGLPIVRDILTSIGGEIQVESSPGRGTVVRVFLVAAATSDDPSGRAGSHAVNPIGN